MMNCASCQGNGEEICLECNGSGKHQNGNCPDCMGEGCVCCRRCNGNGIID
ncbi:MULTISPECIES: hypothetical protein [Fictibacillus]|uniref:Uncharacterized protein n=1 Tax=Fictibacillus terranigra TaxID=3058424 RepID=A0ABT8ECE5_9BACL|nr:hypothetical protein [Fictibacillus sp. CENA-BCM004]MDN4075561.1 hypothetical protein [Fictibacillus sp. CENA-BCM004]